MMIKYFIFILVLTTHPYEIQIQDYIKSLDSDISEQRIEELTKYFYESSKKHNVPIHILINIAYIESRFENKTNNGNIGVMQINWNSHKKRLIKQGLSYKDLHNDRVNIDKGAELIKLIGFSSMKTLVKKYNGRTNKKYLAMMEELNVRWKTTVESR